MYCHKFRGSIIRCAFGEFIGVTCKLNFVSFANGFSYLAENYRMYYCHLHLAG
jgi:hypothetical protein